MLGSKAYDGRSFVSQLHYYELHLFNVIDELSEAWDARFHKSNRLPHHFGKRVTGAIDSFPVYIQHLPGRVNKTYNGKYQRHILKVSCIVIDNYNYRYR